jgi:NDP-sugar pyrophosphorylase family protein
MKYQTRSLGHFDMPTPKKLMELQETINEDLLKASLPEVRINGFRLPDQALEITFERETVIGENKEKLWEIINGHYKKLLRDLELKE